jgi:ATP-binding cassette subfamily B protein/subfamily B ATP-binding cassette protein MsbA
VGRVRKSSKQRYEQYLEESRNRVHHALRRLLPAWLARVISAPTSQRPTKTDQPHAVIDSSLRTRIARYKRWLSPGYKDLILVTALGVLGIGFDMVWPLASAQIIDHVVMSHTLTVAKKARLLAIAAALMALVFLVNSAINWWRSLRNQLLMSKLQVGLRANLFARILRLPLQHLHELRTGGLLSRLSSDVDRTATLVQQGFLAPLLAVVRLVATLSIIFTLNPKIAGVVVLALPPVLILQAFWARKMRGVWRSIGQEYQELDARVAEGISGIRVVRGFRRESREEAAHRIGLNTITRKQLLATRTQRTLATIWDLILPFTQITIVCYGGYLVVQGQTTLGIVIAFQGYLWRLLEPVLTLANSIADTQRGLAAMDRVFELLDLEEDKPDVPGAREAPTQVDSIRFRNVSFAYRPGVPVITDFDLEIAGGQVVALVGPSGAGKTTLTDLLARFFDPTEGTIEINGTDLRQLRLASYRKLFGIVSQEVFLFDGSIRDNIAYARNTVSFEQVEQAARAANAHDFIMALPEGYDTLAGERGVKLSGGQRQRLSIARALLADPAILILDEATSNLDTESEILIQQALQTLLRSRTTIVIAHRLSTVQKADVICVVDHGKLVEQGSHAALVHRKGLYAQMVARQHHDIAHTLGTPDLLRSTEDPPNAS